jgi:hypothetical protein
MMIENPISGCLLEMIMHYYLPVAIGGPRKPSPLVTTSS